MYKCYLLRKRPRVGYRMRLLTTSLSLRNAFQQLLVRHKKVSFAVAWASHDFPTCRYLLKHDEKISRGIIGTHFYQTDPSFIQHFFNDMRVKFNKAASGVFHPKLYFFETSKSDWSFLIGSANFTAAAFSANVEACLLFEATDDRLGTIRPSLERTIAQYWNNAGYFKQHELEQYRFLWRIFRQRRKGMAGDFG